MTGRRVRWADYRHPDRITADDLAQVPDAHFDWLPGGTWLIRAECRGIGIRGGDSGRGGMGISGEMLGLGGGIDEGGKEGERRSGW